MWPVLRWVAFLFVVPFGNFVIRSMASAGLKDWAYFRGDTSGWRILTGSVFGFRFALAFWFPFEIDIDREG